MIEIHICKTQRIGTKEYTETRQTITSGPLFEAELNMVMADSDLPAELSQIEDGWHVVTFKDGKSLV